MKLLYILSLVMFLALGCASSPEGKPSVADKMMQTSVSSYCKAPLELRMLTRSIVNEKMAPMSIKVSCYGDMPEDILLAELIVQEIDDKKTKFSDEFSEKVEDFVKSYCGLSPELRAISQANLDQSLFPNKVEIGCDK